MLTLVQMGRQVCDKVVILEFDTNNSGFVGSGKSYRYDGHCTS